jgi:hypothetical protein
MTTTTMQLPSDVMRQLGEDAAARRVHYLNGGN